MFPLALNFTFFVQKTSVSLMETSNLFSWKNFFVTFLQLYNFELVTKSDISDILLVFYFVMIESRKINQSINYPIHRQIKCQNNERRKIIQIFYNYFTKMTFLMSELIIFCNCVKLKLQLSPGNQRRAERLFQCETEAGQTPLMIFCCNSNCQF